jgi:putative acetyltransferase
MEIRAERLDDLEFVRQVNVSAFGREHEANLVAQLRGGASTLSFVAIKLDRVVGHILFSPVTIDGECDRKISILGLAPVAVLPEEWRQGIGSLLIRHGLAECERFGAKAIVVLGAARFYQRFSFISAQEYGLSCEYDVPNGAFMALELVRGALKNCTGIVKYRPEFKMFE